MLRGPNNFISLKVPRSASSPLIHLSEPFLFDCLSVSWVLLPPLPVGPLFLFPYLSLVGPTSMLGPTPSTTSVLPLHRGGFACVADEGSGRIVVAGGRRLEVLDVERGEWKVGEERGRRRAGCVGFVRGEEFWVMGGYEEYHSARVEVVRGRWGVGGGGRRGICERKVRGAC